jgi:hypothetical protein
MGSKARSAIRDIAPLLGHESWLVRERAAKAVNQIVPQETPDSN